MITRVVDWDEPAGAMLRAAQRAEVAARYGTPDTEPGPIPTGEDVIRFLLVLDDDGTPIGCGGLREIDDHTGEVKRMFVVPERRGSGAATLVLRTLEAIASVELGWNRLLLETGDRLPEAIRFYEREGYTHIPKFGHYTTSEYAVCFERVLTEVG